MSVSSTTDLQKLDAVLYDRPAGRNIVGHAVETITNLRTDLTAARAERDALAAEQAQKIERLREEVMHLKRMEQHGIAGRRALLDEIDVLRQDLAATLAERDALAAQLAGYDTAREMLNVQDNQIDALRALLKVARSCIYSLDAREIYADELDRIDAALAGKDAP